MRRLQTFRILVGILALGTALSSASCKKPADGGGGGSTTSVPIEGVKVIREVVSVVVAAAGTDEFVGYYKNTPYSALVIRQTLQGSAHSAAPIRSAAPGLAEHYLVKDERFVTDLSRLFEAKDKVEIVRSYYINDVSPKDPTRNEVALVHHVISPEPNLIVTQVTSYADLPNNSPLASTNYAVCESEKDANGYAGVFAIKIGAIGVSSTYALAVRFTRSGETIRNYLDTTAIIMPTADGIYTYTNTDLGYTYVNFLNNPARKCQVVYHMGTFDGTALGTWFGTLPDFGH